VDRDEYIIVELMEDAKDLSTDAAGLSIYSNSKSIVSSYISIFESLWNQTELYEQLKESKKQVDEANEKLKSNENMQREFVNIAAHELRNPVQPILGLTEILRTRIRAKKRSYHGKNGNDDDIMDVIIRNATRLKQLTETILDITRIENRSLIPTKKNFV
jgi:two-component system, OmpR family, sensor histidine kinase VicK